MAQEQAGSIGQVRETVREMDTMTQQNAAMVEQATAAARSRVSEGSVAETFSPIWSVRETI